jgi:hypothetical protein
MRKNLISFDAHHKAKLHTIFFLLIMGGFIMLPLAGMQEFSTYLSSPICYPYIPLYATLKRN